MPDHVFLVLAPMPDRPAGPGAGYFKGGESGHGATQKGSSSIHGRISREWARNAERALIPLSNGMRHAMVGTRPTWNMRISHWDQSAMGRESNGIALQLTSCGHAFVICVVCPFMSGPYH